MGWTHSKTTHNLWYSDKNVEKNHWQRWEKQGRGTIGMTGEAGIFTPQISAAGPDVKGEEEL